jgi:hypothetical protein
VLAFECVDDGHQAFVCFWSLSATPLPLPFANYSGSAASRVFVRNCRGIKGLGLRRMEPAGGT